MISPELRRVVNSETILCHTCTLPGFALFGGFRVRSGGYSSDALHYVLTYLRSAVCRWWGIMARPQIRCVVQSVYTVSVVLTTVAMLVCSLGLCLQQWLSSASPPTRRLNLPVAELTDVNYQCFVARCLATLLFVVGFIRMRLKSCTWIQCRLRIFMTSSNGHYNGAAACSSRVVIYVMQFVACLWWSLPKVKNRRVNYRRWGFHVKSYVFMLLAACVFYLMVPSLATNAVVPSQPVPCVL